MPKKLLLVDDDRELCQELAEILRDEGYAVDATSDSAKGDALISEKAYDLYLFDYKMTGFNGIELLKKAKARNAASHVFIMSGRPFLQRALEQEHATELVTAVIDKPFDIEILLGKIKSALK